MSVVKLLNIGESKSGKTGALASLLIAGYNVHVLDYDNGTEIVENVLRDKPEALARLRVKKLRDKITFVNGQPKIKAPPTAYKDAGKTLVEWDFGSFTSKDILVIDTLTKMSEAAFNEACFLGGRLNQRPQLQDYGWMADSVKMFIDMITGDDINCHLIVNTHIRYFGGEEETQTSSRGLPNAKGQEISRTVSTYFNTVVLTRSMGSGPGTKRVISTQPQGVIEVATSSPSTVKATYPVETGMAVLFEDILGHGPQKETSK